MKKARTKFKRHHIYLTKGGWEAEVIFIRYDGRCFYAVHRPGCCAESQPILHFSDGAPDIDWLMRHSKMRVESATLKLSATDEG